MVIDSAEQATLTTDNLAKAWREHAPSALRLATVLVGPADAHDMVVSAFLRCTNKRGWETIENFDRYLFRAVRNGARNYFRSRRRRWKRDLTAVAPTTTMQTHSDTDLLAAISRLSLPQRTVVYFAHWEQMTESEIAETLGKLTGTIHRNLARAREALREDIA